MAQRVRYNLVIDEQQFVVGMYNKKGIVECSDTFKMIVESQRQIVDKGNRVVVLKKRMQLSG